MKFSFIALGMFLGFSAFAQCPSAPYGEPVISGNVKALCHAGYFSDYDVANKVPRFVSWNLTSDHAVSCNARVDAFAQDPLAEGQDVPPTAYRGSGYDRGHMADADDFNWNPAQARDSFFMTNMAPQVPGLNRGPWKWVEQASRDWAVSRKSIWIYAGPVVKDDDGKFSSYGIDQPTAFWKVVYDPATNEAIGFLMPNKKFSSSQVLSTVVPIEFIERNIGFTIPLPAGVVKDTIPTMDHWQVNSSLFSKAHQNSCSIR